MQILGALRPAFLRAHPQIARVHARPARNRRAVCFPLRAIIPAAARKATRGPPHTPGMQCALAKLREQKAPGLISHEVLLECGASPHRLQISQHYSARFASISILIATVWLMPETDSAA